MQFLGNAEKVWVDKFCVKICFAFKVPDLVWRNYIAAKHWPCVIVSSFCLIAVIILHVLVDWLCVYACLFCSPSGGAQQMQGLLIDESVENYIKYEHASYPKFQNIQSIICLDLDIELCIFSWYDTKWTQFM